MKMKGKMIATVVAAVMLFAFCLVFPGISVAKSPAPIAGLGFNVGISMQENLKSLVGKDVYVHLRSGDTLQGYVKAVGDVQIHLEKLAGKDFYDALIRLDDISAIEVKFRDIK